MSRRMVTVAVAVLSLFLAAGTRAATRLAGIVPVAGSTGGANGANFRTALQLNNGSNATMRGSIVFHPAGRPGRVSDPQLAYELQPHQTLSYADVVTSTGATGLGSLDVLVDGDATPNVVARAYDDGGAAGTKGVTVPLLPPSSAATAGQLITLVAPADATRMRFNIGLRSLERGARVRILVFSEDGATRVVGTERAYGADFFEQRTAADFAEAAVGPNESVGILVLEGSVIAYGTMTDNRTNDPSIQIGVQHNSVPVAVPASARLASSQQKITIDLKGIDADSESLLFTIVTPPAHSTLGPLQRIDGQHMTVELTTGASFTDRDAFVFRVEDENGGSSEAETVIVRSDSRAPSAEDGAVTTKRSQPVTIVLRGNDPDGDTLTFSILVPPSHGTLASIVTTSSNAASVEYTPADGFVGNDFLLFQVGDGNGNTDIGRVDINVSDQPADQHPPVSANDFYTTNEDDDLNVAAAGVLANDSDADGDSLTATLVTNASNGSVTLNANGSFTYRPNAEFSGTDTFTYRVSDGHAVSAVATAGIEVTPVNDPPSFNVATPVTVLEDSGAGTIAAFVNGVNAGPGEADQTVTFHVTTNTPSLFAVQPSIDAAGALHFTPAPNANGVAALTITASDDGGGANTSDPRSTTITITAVNDAPLFTGGANVIVAEDAGAQSLAAWATGLDKGAANETVQTLSFVVTNDTNAALFDVAPAIAANGTLIFTPAANANGIATITIVAKDNGGTANGGSDTSAPQTFIITVAAVDDAPSFTFAPSPSVAEDSAASTMTSFVTAISTGPADESTQTVSFNTTNDANALFAVQPTIGADGTLTFTPAADAFGSATVSVIATDSDGASSAPQTFPLTIRPVNDPPSFTKGVDANAVEDAGPRSIANWAPAISTGPANESAQTVSFVVTGNTNAALFASGPAIAADGTLTFTTAQNANGTATITLVAKDNGGGADTSAPQTFDIVISAINDAPSFILAASPSVAEDSPAQNASAFATAIVAGPADESAQTVTFALTNDANALFATQPAIAADGTLTYTPALDASGIATVTVIATDNLGASSAPQIFTITLTAVNDAPSNSIPGPQSVDEDSVLALNGANAFMVADVDASSLQLTLTATSGTLTLGSTAALAFTAGNGTANTTMTFSGTIAALNGALQTLTFRPLAEYSGTATIDLTTNDLGVTGAGGAQTASGSLSITVVAVNDVPAVNAATFTLDENSANGASAGTVTYSDPDAGQTHTFAIASGNTGGAFAIDSSTGALTVASSVALDFETTPTFALTISVSDDGTPAQTGSATITVSLRDINEAPTASNASFSVTENSADGTPVGSVSASDVDAGQSLTYAITSGNSAGTFAIHPATGAITIANHTLLDFETNASFSFGISVTDDGTPSLGTTASVNITVLDANDAPVALALSNDSVAENLAAGTVVGTFSTTDQDAGDTHTYALVAGSGSTDNAAFTISANQLQLAGPLDYEAKSALTIRVRTTDGGGLTFEQTFTINVTDANDPPVAIADASDVTEDAATNTTSGNVLSNDSDIDPANALHVASVNGSAANVATSVDGTYGSIVVNADGSYVYTLDNTRPAVQAIPAGQLADDGFTYAAADPSNATATAAITIHVHGANDPPSFTSPAATAATEDAAYTYAIGVDDADAPETLVVTATTKPAWLTLIDHGDRTATLSGTPANSDVPSTNDVVLDVFDGTTHVTQSFSITVANTNDPPIAVDDLFELDAAPLPMINGDFNLVTNDSDPDIGDTFGISRVQGSESNVWDYTYTPYSTTEIDGDGTLWYYPNTVAWNRLNRNAVVTDVITYELMDSHGATSNAALRVTIHGANDAPSATADTYSVPPSGTLHATTVLVNDSDLDLVPVADTLTAILVEDSTIAQGTLAFHADGTFDYVKTCTPCAQDHETFTYKVSDGLLDSATVTVTINYNAPPVATADVYTINEDETLTTTGATGVRANDSDADGAADIQHVIVITQPVNGTLTPITSSAFGDEMPVDGAFTYVPNPDFNGVDTFQYKLRDSAGTESSIVTVTITVNPINDVPRFSLKGAPDIEVCGGSGGYWAPGQAVSFDAGGPSDESSQNFAFVVTVDDPSLFGPAVVCHGGATETDPIDCDVSIIGSVHISQYDGSIDFSLAPGASGSTTVHVKILDDGGTANGGVNLSAEQTFVIHVLPAANAPSFTEGPDVYGANDGVVKTFTNWATSISANDPAQTVGFTLTADNPSLFAVQPAIASDGALTFTPAVGAHGTTTVTIIATDNGNALCGSTTSAPRTFTIGTDTNVAPSFLEGTDQNVLQNGGAVTVPDWATSINPGAPEEAAQHLIFTVVATDPSLFTVQPAVSFNGTLTFTPNATAIGTTPVSITLQDDGGTANGGADTSATQTFNITVAKLNHAPDITVSPSSITLPFSATDNPQTFSTFLTINGPGAGDSDPGQTPYTVSVFVTSHDNFALFAAGPALTQVGASNVYELTFTITGNQSGNAVLRVTVNDSGGTALGGTNTATQDVSLTVTPGPNHAPTYAFTANPLGTPAGSTPQTYPGFLTVTSPGLNDRPQEPYTVTIAPVSVPAGLFSSAPTLTQGPADGATEWDLQFTPAVGQTGTATYQVTIKDSGGLAYGGTDTAVTSFDIFVGAPVNHAPSFTLTPNPVSLSNTSTSAQTTVTGFLTVTSPGAGDPVQAPYTPSVTLLWTTNTSLFATTPFFLAQGSPSTATVFDLKLQRAVNQTGSATYLVTLQDSGGTLNGGVNQSTQTVTITLTATASAATPAPGAAKAYSALAYPHLGVRMTNSDLHYRLLDDITGGTPPYTATIVSYIGSLGQQRVTIDDPLTGAFTYQPGLVMYTNNRPVSQGFTYKVCDSLAVCSSNLTFLFNYQNGAVNMTTLRFYDMNAPSIYPGGREPEGTAERPFNASMLPTLSANEGITNPEVIFVVRKGSYTLGPATKTFSRLVGEGGPTLSLASLGISALPAGTVIGPAVPLSTNLADRPVITFSSIGSNVGFVVTPDGGGMFKNLIFTADPAATDNGNIPLRIKSSSAADVYTIDNVEITGGANAIMFTGPATTNLTNSVIETNTTGIAIGDTYWIGGGAKVNVINTSTLNSCTSCRLIGAFGTASSATQLTFAADSPITKTAGAWNSAGLTGTYTFNGAVTVTKSGSEDGLVLDVTGTATIAFNGPVQVTTDKGNPLFVSGTPWITGPAPTATSTITMPNAANSFKMLNTATSGSFLGIRMTSVLIGAAGMNIAGLDLKGTVISLTNTNQGTPGTVTLSGSEVGRTGMPCVSTNAAGPIDRSSLTTSLCTP